MENRKEIEERILELGNKLTYYTKLYDEGHPAISDKEWDDMYFELLNLENKTGIRFSNSPTQCIPYKVVNKLEKVEHNHPMLSLDKTKDIDEVHKMFANKQFIAMAKMDGLTCSLRYLNGKLVSAETRGNGIIGENILHNALQVKNIPKRISAEQELVIDGEIICTYKDFEPFKEEYKNPRNFASGSIRLLDSEESSARNLTFVAWDCIKGLDFEETLSSKLDILKNLGFTIVPFTTAYGEKSVEKCIEIIKETSSNYPIDGIVFKYEFCDDYNDAGRTDHHFKGGIAYKFYDDEYETVLRDIEWTMGRTGILTPVAIFDPVDIDGTEVSRASLHNLSIMEKLGIKYKDTKIIVYKANMIIPQILKVLPYESKIACLIDIPKLCPICYEETIIKQDNESKVLYCNNPNCEGKLVNRIEHFLGKKGLDAKGISKATIEKLIEWEWIQRPRDIFELNRHKKEWINKTGFGEISVTKIIESIGTSCDCTLESVISAAGIPLIGKTYARTLSKHFLSYNAFRQAIKNDYDFSQLEGFGYEMHKAIKTFDYEELDYIVENYLRIKEENNTNYCAIVPNSISLEGITYCITGKLNLYKNRQELVNKIESLGGKVVSSVSKNVNWLINNDINSTSSKNLKAKELGIGIMTEEMFNRIINND